MKLFSRFALTLALCLIPAAWAEPAASCCQSARQPGDIVTAASEAGQFKTLITALGEAGLVEALQGSGPFTVFAPTDEAFAKLPPGTLESLLKDKEKLKAILTYHVVSGKLQASDVLGGASLKTLQGQPLQASQEDSRARINGAQILKTDLPCSNGVIHVIDRVLLPQ